MKNINKNQKYGTSIRPKIIINGFKGISVE